MDLEIASVIREYPELGTLLEKYGIGCITCTIGTCLLRDVLNIHQIPQDEGIKLLAEMKELLRVSVPLEWAPREQKKTGHRELKDEVSKDTTDLSPIQQLVLEHKHIKTALAVIPEMLKKFSEKGEVDILLFSEVISFIRNYADRYHHAKEEDILFPYAPENFPPIKAMLEEHVQGRNYIKNAEKAAYIGNIDEMEKNMLGYRDLLSGHIDREDTVLYPWFERNISMELFEKMGMEFTASNKRFGEGYASDYEKWAENLFKTLNPIS